MCIRDRCFTGTAINTDCFARKYEKTSPAGGVFTYICKNAVRQINPPDCVFNKEDYLSSFNSYFVEAS